MSDDLVTEVEEAITTEPGTDRVKYDPHVRTQAEHAIAEGRTDVLAEARSVWLDEDKGAGTPEALETIASVIPPEALAEVNFTESAEAVEAAEYDAPEGTPPVGVEVTTTDPSTGEEAVGVLSDPPPPVELVGGVDVVTPDGPVDPVVAPVASDDDADVG